jgi:hypothetical protein
MTHLTHITESQDALLGVWDSRAFAASLHLLAPWPRLPRAGVRPRANMPPPPPDGLLTSAEAAHKLRCSIKTLRAHVAAGDVRYVIIGKGTKRPRIRFAPADLDEFITNQTRKDVACPPTSPKTAARRISTTTSKCEVIGFTARRNARRGAKPKK